MPPERPLPSAGTRPAWILRTSKVYPALPCVSTDALRILYSYFTHSPFLPAQRHVRARRRCRCETIPSGSHLHAGSMPAHDGRHVPDRFSDPRCGRMQVLPGVRAPLHRVRREAPLWHPGENGHTALRWIRPLQRHPGLDQGGHSTAPAPATCRAIRVALRHRPQRFSPGVRLRPPNGPGAGGGPGTAGEGSRGAACTAAGFAKCTRW